MSAAASRGERPVAMVGKRWLQPAVRVALQAAPLITDTVCSTASDRRYSRQLSMPREYHSGSQRSRGADGSVASRPATQTRVVISGMSAVGQRKLIKALCGREQMRCISLWRPASGFEKDLRGLESLAWKRYCR